MNDKEKREAAIEQLQIFYKNICDGKLPHGDQDLMDNIVENIIFKAVALSTTPPKHPTKTDVVITNSVITRIVKEVKSTIFDILEREGLREIKVDN